MNEPTACPIEECDETVDYGALFDHMYSAHDADELCATVANLVAEAAGLTAKLAVRDHVIEQQQTQLAQMPALLGAVSAARVTAKYGDMPEQTRRELNDALNPAA